MNKHWENMRITRFNFVKLLDSLSPDQINRIPEGFNNNIIWNFGHIIVSQQLLCYTFSGQTPTIDAEVISRFRKGTKPEQDIEPGELEELKSLAFSTIEKTQKDFEAGLFTYFKPYTTSMGVELRSIEDAISFIPVHDGIHLGYAMALKKLVV